MLFQKLLKPASAATGIEYVGGYAAASSTANSNVNVSLTALTGGIASSPSIGDLVIVYIGASNGTSVTPAIIGYTTITYLTASDSYDANMTVGYKILTAADTSVTVNGGAGTTASISVYVSVWRNVDATYPFDVPATTATGIDSIFPNPPAITPITTGSYIVAGGTGAHSRGVATYGSTDLADFKSEGAGNTNDSTIGGGYKQWTSGAFNPAAFTCSASTSTAYSWASATLALRPTGRIFPSFVDGYPDNGAGSVVVPAHQAGDWIIFVNASSATTTPPALTTGFTNIITFTNNSTNNAQDRAVRVQYKISDGSATTLSCSNYGGVAILRNVTALLSSKDGSGIYTTTSSTVPVSMTPTVGGSLCIFSGYDPGNYVGATTINYANNFGGWARTDALGSPITGSLTALVAAFPIYFGAEFI